MRECRVYSTDYDMGGGGAVLLEAAPQTHKTCTRCAWTDTHRYTDGQPATE